MIDNEKKLSLNDLSFEDIDRILGEEDISPQSEPNYKEITNRFKDKIVLRG